MDVIEFLDKYLFSAKGYNYFNTFIYGLILVATIFVFYKLFKKLKIKINSDLAKAIVPFMVLWSVIRVLVDMKVYPENFFTVTPGLFYVLLFIAIPVLVLSIKIEKKFKIKFWKTTFAFGTALIFPNLLKLRIKNLYGFLWIFLIFGLVLLVMFLLYKKFKIKFLRDKLSFLAIYAHMLDATATFVAIDFYGMSEKHPLVAFFTELTGTASILYLLKLAVLIPFIFVLNKYEKEKEFKAVILITIIIMGVAAGFRDALLVLVS